MDYQKNDILQRITQSQIQQRLKNNQYEYYNNTEEQNIYKTNYYKDIFYLENKLQQFQRNDKIYREEDFKKKDRILDIINDRKQLKEKEDIFYNNIANLRNNIGHQSLPQIHQDNRNNNFFTPQKAIKDNNNYNLFATQGKNLSTKNERKSFHHRGQNSAISFEHLKNFRQLNEALPTQEDYNKNNLNSLSQILIRSPYVNNMINLTSDTNINSQTQIVTYLRALQNDLNLQCSFLKKGSDQYQDKQKQIDHLNHILQFIEHKNPFKPQQQLNVEQSDCLNGFHINWDFVKYLPSFIKRIKINYGIFKRENTFFTYRSTSDYYAHHQNYLDMTPDRQVAIINEQHVIQSMVSRQNAVLYLDLWAYDQSDEVITKYGWSLLDIFDGRGNFLPGKYKIPFYPKEMKPHTLFQNGLRYLNHNCFCYVNIQTTKQTFQNNIQQFDYESEYYLPPLHQKPTREEIIYQPESLQIYTSSDDMPQIGIPKKQTAAHEQPLTFEMIIKECQDVKLEKAQSLTMTSFSTFTAINVDIPSLGVINQEEEEKGFEITINGFTNIFFQQTEFFKIKGAFLKFDKSILLKINQYYLQQKYQLKNENQIIIDEDDKRTVTQDYILTQKDQNNQVKCEFDIHYNIDFNNLNISGYSELIQSAEKQNENEYYLFFCFYNQNDKLIGWTDVDLFDIENKKVVLKEGKFTLQLFNPPLQRPPFFGPKTCSIIEMKYEISGYQEIKEKRKKRDDRKKTMILNKRQIKKDEEDKEIEEKKKSDQEFKELNEKHSIKIEIISLKNYIFTRNTFGCNIKFILGNKVLMDSKNSMIQYLDNLDVSSTEKSTINFSHERIIDVNVGILKKQIPEDVRDKAKIQLEIVLTNKKNEHLGLIELPLFKQQFQITRKENQPLSKKAKDKLTVQKYELEYNIELFERQPEKQYDNSMGFLIEISQITNYRETFKTHFQTRIYSGNEILTDFKGKKLIIDSTYPSKVDTKKKLSTFEQSIEIALNIQELKDKRKKDLFKIYALIIFEIEKKEDSKEQYGWFAQPLFQNDIFYEGNFEESIYKPPQIEIFPIDPKKMKKLTSKIKFDIKEVKISI